MADIFLKVDVVFLNEGGVLFTLLCSDPRVIKFVIRAASLSDLKGGNIVIT
jgi:hypothetical protein